VNDGFYEKIAVCIAVSIAAHLAFGYGVAQLPPPEMPKKPHKVEVRVVSPPRDPEPEPPKQPDPAPTPDPKPVVHEKPRAAPRVTVHDVAPKDAPPPDHPAVVADTSTTPVFGVTMESTSQAGGPAVPVGNTTQPAPTANAGSAPKPLAEPVAAYEVTKMPLPQGRCAGKYTDEAKQAGIEGVVVLDLVVGEDGRARDIQVVSGLTHGLTEAAIAALRACHFDPGERNGTRVPVRIRGFKIRFVLAEGDQP
jgi:periplasmic protein TonB